MAIPGAVGFGCGVGMPRLRWELGAGRDFNAKPQRSQRELKQVWKQWIDHRRRRQDRLEKEGHDGGAGRVR